MNSCKSRLYDVIVIGGGPAGSTTASLLSQRKFKVALFEKDKHPKFHVGESLLPMTMPLLRKLGIYEQVKKMGKIKKGASFFVDQYEKHTTYPFERALDCKNKVAYHVKRPDFDKLLFDDCVNKGVDASENATVIASEMQPDGLTKVTVKHENGEDVDYLCHFVVDASGRDTFLSKRDKLKQANPKHRSAAIFAHFDHADNYPELKDGNIGIYWFKHGWCWLIPFMDGSVSVGCVCSPEYFKQRKSDLKTFYLKTIRECKHLAKHLESSSVKNEVRVTGNYSYLSQKIYGDNYIMVGDSYAFVDPVFSSGIHIAMRSAFEAANAVEKILNNPHYKQACLKRYEKFVDRGIHGFEWIIYHMLRPSFQHLFMNPRNIFKVEQAIISILAGDVFDKTRLRGKLLLFKLFYHVHKLKFMPNLQSE